MQLIQARSGWVVTTDVNLYFSLPLLSALTESISTPH